ncbi:MAG: thioredoxin family protein [Halobacteriota archaeon]
MKDVVLLTHKGCPICPVVRSFWEDLQKDCDFNYKHVEVYTPEGLQLLRKYGIRSVPTTLIDQKVEFIGVPDRAKALAKIDCTDRR